MVSVAGQVFFFGLLVLVAVSPTAATGSPLRTASNPQFEVVGLHGRSVTQVEALSRHIVRMAERYLDRSGLQFPQRILVSLKPTEFVDFEGDYIVRFSERGFVNLDLHWRESLSLLTTCRALTEALLLRYSIFNHGQAGPQFLPEWPATAIGTKVYFQLRPAKSNRVADWLELPATPTVASLLQRKWSDSNADFNGYAFLLAMERSNMPTTRIGRLMKASIGGENVASELATFLQLRDPLAEDFVLDDWWVASWEHFLASPTEPMETMQASREWIEALADLSNTDFAHLNLSQLWNERDDEALRELIEARYEILKVRISRVNPAYFNAARSLGALFESYLSGERRHRYIFRLSVFLGDMEDGRALEATVSEALSPGRR